MRRRALLSTLALPLLLAVLVATLGVLQYRWLGQASEADRVGMRRSIDERARLFSTELDKEIASAQIALSAGAGIDAADSGTRMAEQIETWRKTARFPEMVREIYAVRFEAGEIALHHFSAETRTFDKTDWPERLHTVRDRFVSLKGAEPDGDVVLMARATVVPSVPAVISPARPSVSLGGNLATLHTVVEYDKEVLRTVVLPALSRQYFSGDNGDPYRLAIFDEQGAPFFVSDEGAGEIQPDTADASASILRIRPELLPEQRSITFVAERTAPMVRREIDPGGGPTRVVVGGATIRGGTGQTSALRTEILNNNASWTLRLQHPAGSIDAAVAAGRRRNLWVNFGMLGILVAGCTLIVLNARRAEQLAARQMEFVAAVSHELRTPVAVMRSAAQNLSAGVVFDADQARRYGALIEAEGRRLTDTVEQVLEFATVSQAPRTAMTTLDPAEIVRHTVDSHRPLLESQKFSVDLTIGDDLPHVIGQADALGRAVQNLIGNAVKYAASGRWVGIDVKRAEEAGREEVRIAVSDRGPGVDAQDLAHVFEPFYRGRRAIDDQIQGSGLGLSLVERIVESQGGRVTVQSTAGSGATFTIHLPAAHDSPSSI